MRFKYRALDPEGEIFEDVIEAPDRDAAIRRLRDDHFLPVMVSSLDEPSEPMPRTPTKRLTSWPATRHRLAAAPLAMLTRDIQMLIASDLSPDKALDVIASTTKSTTTATIASDLRAGILRGLSLSQAMGSHPAVFDPLYRSMVGAGEAAGRLGDALDQLACYLEEVEELKASIRSALRYPIFLALGTLASLAVMFALVVPQFELLLRESTNQLPAAARAAFALSGFVGSYGWLLAAGVVLIWLALRLGLMGGAGRWRWDEGVLHLPVIGPMTTELETERYARAFSILLHSGLALTEAMEIAAPVCRNRRIRAHLGDAVTRVRRGETLAAALGADRVVPTLAMELIQIGEESGRLAPMLRRVADTLAARRRRTLERAVGAIGPSAIILVGLVVAVMVVAMYSAMLSLRILVE